MISNEVKNWVSVEDASQITGKSISTIRRWVKSTRESQRAKQNIREVPFRDKGGYKILIMRGFLVEQFGSYKDSGGMRFMSGFQSPAISHISQADIYSVFDHNFRESFAQLNAMQDTINAMQDTIQRLEAKLCTLDGSAKNLDDGEIIEAESEAIPDGHCVYLEQDKGNGLVKIGFSTGFQKRRGALLNANPLLENRGVLSATRKDETALHRLFRKKRVKREWFRLTEEDIQYIHKHLDPTTDASLSPGLFD